MTEPEVEDIACRHVQDGERDEYAQLVARGEDYKGVARAFRAHVCKACYEPTVRKLRKLLEKSGPVTMTVDTSDRIIHEGTYTLELGESPVIEGGPARTVAGRIVAVNDDGTVVVKLAPGEP